jgi:hypothetical protein
MGFSRGRPALSNNLAIIFIFFLLCTLLPYHVQVSALVVMASKHATQSAVSSVNGDPAAPLLVMPLLKVLQAEHLFLRLPL